MQRVSTFEGVIFRLPPYMKTASLWLELSGGLDITNSWSHGCNYRQQITGEEQVVKL